jgi:phosphoribosylanthranilate isomerase
VTSVDDARWLARLDIDAIGLNFHPASPRCVTLDVARAIAGAVPPSIAIVGVFVDRSPADLLAIASDISLAALQLHGSEPTRFVLELDPHPVVKAFRVQGPQTLDAVDAWTRELDAACRPRVGLLLDAYRPGEAGGTGDTFDWSLWPRGEKHLPTYLAGGIHAGNVAQAIRICRPLGIDLATGVESAPGKKDPKAVEALLTAVADVQERP